MQSTVRFSVLFAMGLLLCSATKAHAGGCRYGEWNQTKQGNYVKMCHLPGGGQRTLVLMANQPQWMYLWNATKQAYTARCPSGRHPNCDAYYGAAQAGQGGCWQLLPDMCIEQAQNVPDPAPGSLVDANGMNANGQRVEIDAPNPNDLPPGV